MEKVFHGHTKISAITNPGLELHVIDHVSSPMRKIALYAKGIGDPQYQETTWDSCNIVLRDNNEAICRSPFCILNLVNRAVLEKRSVGFYSRV